MSENISTDQKKPVRLRLDEDQYAEARTLLDDAWRQFRKHKLAMGAVFVILAIIIGITIGPLLWHTDPEYIDITTAYANMSAPHPFGSDNLGRDMLARIIYGGRVSLAIGMVSMFISITIGSLVGLGSGYFRTLDTPLMRLTDLFLALPVLPLLLVIMMLFREPLRTSLGPEAGIFILMVSVIGITNWMPTARLVRGEVLVMKETDFIVAARSVGAGDSRIMFRHILPNVLSPIIVAATFSIASAIITESALSFLGLGFPPDFPTWGRLLFDGQTYLEHTPALVLWPGLAISLTVLAVNFIGDGLRDALDPRLRK